MTREEKQKAIDALKISAPVMAVTQEGFSDYIQTLNKIMDWLEQEPTPKNDLAVDWESYKDVDGNSLDDLILEVLQNNFDCGNTYGYKVADEIIALLPSVTPQEPFINKPCVSDGVCEHDKNKVLDKIRAEIEHMIPCSKEALSTKLGVLEVIDKYKSESEG